MRQINNSNKAYSLNTNDRRTLFFLLFVPCLLIIRVLDNDTWFLLNSGRYVMEYGIPHIEPFSIHQDLQFVLQQWLTDVIFWVTYNNHGENGLFLIVTICYLIITFLMFKLCMKISEGNFFVSFSITLLSSILVFTYMVTRPTIFTLVIIMIELNALENYTKNGKINNLIILPILSLIMINLHAALWPMLFVMMLPYVVDSIKFKVGFIESEGYGVKNLIIIFIAMVLIALVNPYGLDSMTYLYKSMGYPYIKNILEIMHPYVNNSTGALIYIYIFLTVSIYVFYRKGSSKIRYALLTLGTIYMVLTSIRNITYFGLCSLFPLAYYLKDINIEKNNQSKKNKKLRIILVFLIVVTLMFVGYKNIEQNKTNVPYSDLNNTIDYIFANEDTRNIVLYTGFNEGALTQFRGLPSYIDPRAEVYFKKHNNKDDIFNEYFDLLEGKVHYKKVIEKYKFTHLIVTKEDLLFEYLANDVEYKIIYENKTYRLYKKIT